VPRAQLLAGLYRALSKLAAKESTDLS
jgi:hypothetical protein